VSWWHADNDYDDAVGTNDGTTGGAVSFATGIDHEGFNLTGNLGSFVEVPNDASLQFTTAMTIDAWIRPTALSGRIVDKITAFGADGYLLDVIDGQLRMYLGGDNIVSGPSAVLPAGIFTHVAGVYTGTHLALYINGVVVAEKDTPLTAITVNNLPVRIGADSTGGSLTVGIIDEPRVFNRGLSAAEVARLQWQTTNCP